jgi:hypothetical protein
MSTATRAARLVPDEHRARLEAMTVRAALRWPRHPWVKSRDVVYDVVV